MLCFFVCLCMREKERSSTRECEREVFCFKTDSAFKAVLFSLFFGIWEQLFIPLSCGIALTIQCICIYTQYLYTISPHTNDPMFLLFVFFFF